MESLTCRQVNKRKRWFPLGLNPNENYWSYEQKNVTLMLSVVIVTGAIQERSRTLKGPILFEMNYGKKLNSLPEFSLAGRHSLIVYSSPQLHYLNDFVMTLWHSGPLHLEMKDAVSPMICSANWNHGRIKNNMLLKLFHPQANENTPKMNTVRFGHVSCMISFFIYFFLFEYYASNIFVFRVNS